MPSRKRNKGRARRAKLAARCSHGKPTDTIVDVDNVMFEFKVALDSCLEDSSSPYGAYKTAMDRMMSKNKRLSDSWFAFEGTKKDYLLLSLLSLGTSLLLKEGIVSLRGYPTASSYYTGLAAVVASAYLELNELDEVSVLERKLNDLCFGGQVSDSVVLLSLKAYSFLFFILFSDICQREAIKFFHRRISCNCLAEKFKAVKNNPKISGCDSCGEKAKRTDLLLCSGCRVAQYCDRSCQQKKWEVHREYCENV